MNITYNGGQAVECRGRKSPHEFQSTYNRCEITKLFSKLEVLSMLCNIKSLTAPCLEPGGGVGRNDYRRTSVSQIIIRRRGGWKNRVRGERERERTESIAIISDLDFVSALPPFHACGSCSLSLHPAIAIKKETLPERLCVG